MKGEGGKRKTGGFTLLEVLVALTIFALVAGSLLEVFSGGLRNTRLAGEYAEAVIHAQSKLAELNAMETYSTGNETGRFGPVYSWQVEVSEYHSDQTSMPSSPNLSVRPLSIAVEVSWGGRNDRRSVRLQSLVLEVMP